MFLLCKWIRACLGRRILLARHLLSPSTPSFCSFITSTSPERKYKYKYKYKNKCLFSPEPKAWPRIYLIVDATPPNPTFHPPLIYSYSCPLIPPRPRQRGRNMCAIFTNSPFINNLAASWLSPKIPFYQQPSFFLAIFQNPPFINS